MEQNKTDNQLSIIEQYKEDIKRLEVSNDTSSNLENAEKYIQKIIIKDEILSKDDVLELMKQATEHFNFNDDSKQKLIEY